MGDQDKTRKQLLADLAALREQLTVSRERIAELETHEDEYAREGELVRMLRASTPIGLFLVQDSLFVFVNENFRGITGGSPEELLGTDPMKLIFPEDRAMVRDSAIAMLKGERTIPYRYRIFMPDGQVRWLFEGVSSVQYQGKRAVFGHSMDITELERAQEKLEEAYDEELRLRQKLEAEAQRRIEFTRALVHELKTPLTPVLSSSELLYTELREEPWMSIAANIRRGALSLSSRIDELLDLAKVEIGMLRLERTSFDALPLLRRVADDMKVVTSAAEQSLMTELPDELPRVWADRDRLRQIVQNLLINASKFTDEGGEITLRARQDGATLVIEISDNGPGISKKDHKRLFLPYHRSLSDREHLSGLGLGLALCKYLVEMHDGEIWVDSEIGSGSTFSFRLPLANAIKENEIAKQETAPT